MFSFKRARRVLNYHLMYLPVQNHENTDKTNPVLYKKNSVNVNVNVHSGSFFETLLSVKIRWSGSVALV